MKNKYITGKKPLFVVLVIVLVIELLFFSNIISKSVTTEYDFSGESRETYEEIVKVNATTTVYETTVVNDKGITILEKNNIVKRTNKGVNEINGYIWDKVVLANGKEGYVFADNLIIAEEKEYENISFEYENIKYNVYFPTFGVNLETYHIVL
jgi:hypothetical protein